MEQKPKYTETIDWKGDQHFLEFFETNEKPDRPISQCQAIPFTDTCDIVLFKHLNGYNSLPGGTVEEGESHEETLIREVYEESACKVVSCGLIGYFQDTNLTTGNKQYQLRYWADVELLDEPVNDPDGRALERLVVSQAEMSDTLGWADKGQVLLDVANVARNKTKI